MKIKPNEKMLSCILKGTRTNIVINDSAFEILMYCNGCYQFQELLSKLEEEYKIETQMVQDFLNQCIQMGIIYESETRADSSYLEVKGSNTIYYPDILIWEVTNQCPLNCKHCYLGEKRNISFNKDEINLIIELIKSKGITTVQLTGGEVFIHPGIEYIIDRLNELDIIISMSTSGYILNENTCRILQKLKKNASVRVSIDGDENYHNELRGKKDSYSRAIRFIKFLRDIGVEIQLGTVIKDQDDEIIEGLIMTAKQLGVSNHSFSVILDEGNAHTGRQKSKYSNTELQRRIVDWGKKYDEGVYKIQLADHSEVNNCGCGYKLIRLRPDFSITPCPMIDGVIGNLKEESFDDIMERGTRNFMQLCLPKTDRSKMCESCQYGDDCGECVAMALINDRNSNGQCKWASQNNFLNCILRERSNDL